MVESGDFKNDQAGGLDQNWCFNHHRDGWLCPLKGFVSLSMHRPGCLMDVSEAIYDTKRHFRIIGV